MTEDEVWKKVNEAYDLGLTDGSNNYERLKSQVLDAAYRAGVETSKEPSASRDTYAWVLDRLVDLTEDAHEKSVDVFRKCLTDMRAILTDLSPEPGLMKDSRRICREYVDALAQAKADLEHRKESARKRGAEYRNRIKRLVLKVRQLEERLADRDAKWVAKDIWQMMSDDCDALRADNERLLQQRDDALEAERKADKVGFDAGWQVGHAEGLRKRNEQADAVIGVAVDAHKICSAAGVPELAEEHPGPRENLLARVGWLATQLATVTAERDGARHRADEAEAHAALVRSAVESALRLSDAADGLTNAQVIFMAECLTTPRGSALRAAKAKSWDEGFRCRDDLADDHTEWGPDDVAPNPYAIDDGDGHA